MLYFNHKRSTTIQSIYIHTYVWIYDTIHIYYLFNIPVVWQNWNAFSFISNLYATNNLSIITVFRGYIFVSFLSWSEQKNAHFIRTRENAHARFTHTHTHKFLSSRAKQLEIPATKTECHKRNATKTEMQQILEYYIPTIHSTSANNNKIRS